MYEYGFGCVQRYFILFTCDFLVGCGYKLQNQCIISSNLYGCFYLSHFTNYIERHPRKTRWLYLIIIIHNHNDNNTRRWWYPADNEFAARLGIVDGESKGGRVKRMGLGPNWVLNSDRCAAVIKQQISLFRRRTLLPPAARRGLLRVFSTP